MDVIHGYHFDKSSGVASPNGVYYKATSGECGIFVMRQTNTNAVYRNVTVDANGKNIYNVLGREVNASTTVENFVINNAGTITLYGASDTADTPITKPDGMTINPAVTE